jgi:phospholipase C
VAPYRWCEHPAARPVDGAVYVQTVLKALWGNPKLWENTVLFINFDENDGFYDHIVPPTPAAGTADEFVGGLPIGLGPRVPMTVVSPWSRGGWVNSQVFDHTSVLRFLEQWTGVLEPNISAWRRAVCGDLTSCFDFDKANLSLPALPDANKLQAIADQTQSKLPTPTPPPVGEQVVPRQEHGVRPARAIPYQPTANGQANTATGAVTLTLANSGAAALSLGVYPNGAAPAQFLLHPNGQADTTVPANSDGTYDVAVYGPNGFLREFAGRRGGSAVEVTVTVAGDEHEPLLRITLHNFGMSAATVHVTGTRPGAGHKATFRVPAGGTVTTDRDVIDEARGWYDVLATVDGDSAYRRRFASHVENGADTITG